MCRCFPRPVGPCPWQRSAVIRSLPEGLELDDDPARVDLDEVHRFLSTEAYWALGRTPETVQRLVCKAD